MAKTIDVNLLNPFIDATCECLDQMSGLKPKRERLYIKKDALMFGDISGIIGMSNGITGSCIVSFTMPMAENIVASMLGEVVAGNEELVTDGIGEVANMVAGGAKRRFDGSEYSFDISTPTILRSGQPTPEIYNPSGSVCICCEFSVTCESGGQETFTIEIALKPSEK